MSKEPHINLNWSFPTFLILFCWEGNIERLLLDLRKLVDYPRKYFRSVPQAFLFCESTNLPCIGHVWACTSKQMKSTGLSGWPEYFGIFNVQANGGLWFKRCGLIFCGEEAQPGMNFGISHDEKLESSSIHELNFVKMLN